HRSEEAAVDRFAAGAVLAFDDEADVVAAAGAVGGHYHHRHRDHGPGGGVHEAVIVAQFEPRRALDREPEPALAPGLVHQLQGVGVLDPAVGGFAVQRVAVAQRLHDQVRPRTHAHCPGDHEPGQQQPVHDDPRPQHAGGLAVDRVLGGVADQPARVAHLVHDVVAGVDAGTAGDALVLKAVADVDA